MLSPKVATNVKPAIDELQNCLIGANFLWSSAQRKVRQSFPEKNPKRAKKRPNDRPKRAKKRVFVPKNTCFLAEYFLVELGSPPLTENYSAQKPWAKLGVAPPPLSGSLREPVNYYLTDFSLRVLRWGQMAKKSIRGVGGVGGPPKSAKKNSEKNGFLIKKRLS